MNLKSLAVMLCGCLAAACSNGPAQDAGPGDAFYIGPLDAGSTDVQGADALADLGTPGPDAGEAPHDAGAAPVQVARYDHSVWTFGASNAVTFGVFDPADFTMQFGPNDLGTQNTNAYFQAVEQSGLQITQVPLSGDVYVFEGNSGYHLAESGYGDFAWDLTRLTDQGLTFTKTGTAVEHYPVYLNEVFAPLSGTIIGSRADVPDNAINELPPGDDFATIPTNYVGIQVHPKLQVYLLHLAAGTVPDLVPGERINAGDFVGRVGNSGYSLAPHLHVVAYWDARNQPSSRFWSIPMRWSIDGQPSVPMQGELLTP